MLLDVMRRAKVTVAVFDPAQILDSSQQWDQADLDLLLGAGADDADGSFHTVALFGGASFERAAIRLSQQFRIAASDDIISWIDDFASRGTIMTSPRGGPLGRFRQKPWARKEPQAGQKNMKSKYLTLPLSSSLQFGEERPRKARVGASRGFLRRMTGRIRP